MQEDIRRLSIGTLGSLTGYIADISADDFVKFFGILASIATIIYMTICSMEKLGMLGPKSRSKIEQDPGERP